MAVDDIALRSPSGRQMTFHLPTDGTFCAVAERMDLDAALVDVAREAGAEVHEGRAVIATDVGGDGVQLTLDDGEVVQARYVVAADGMWSPVRKQLGASLPGYLGEWHAFRQYFTGVAPDAARALCRVVRARPPARLRSGRSRCPTAGPTSASASTAAAATPCATWPSCGPTC